MSRQLALDAVNCNAAPLIAHTEYSLEYHHDYVRQATGLATGDPEVYHRLYDLWEIDFRWGTSEGLHGDWGSRGRATDMGHAVYAADGSDLRQPGECPFKTVEEVWAFDPSAEYGLPDFGEQVAAFEKMVQDNRAGWPNQLTTGGYYRSTISGCIQTFGWDMFLLACSERAKIEPVLERFAAWTMFHMRAWAETSAEVIIQHDDFVWTEGAFMNPDIYRKVIIPNFAEMWKPLHAAGKKVLFISDGNFMEFAEDIAEAGADGFFFEPMHKFDFMVERFGSSHCLIGSDVDCIDMAFRPWETVQASMDRTFKLAEQCNGLIWAVGNHLPANIPQGIMEQYLAYFKEMRPR